ncbi:MAG: hypothetical protein Q9187_005209 [Circinaria calcarea]
MKFFTFAAAALCSLALGSRAAPNIDGRSNALTSQHLAYSLRARDAVADVGVLIDQIADIRLQHRAILGRAPAKGTSGSPGGSRAGSPGPSTGGTAAYTRMSQYKPGMQAGRRYMFEVIQKPGGEYLHGTKMQAFLLVGDVKADARGKLDFSGNMWDLLKGEDGKRTNTEVDKQRFDAGKGNSLQFRYVGETTGVDEDITRFGNDINKANGEKWKGDKYDCKSFTEQLAAKIKKYNDNFRGDIKVYMWWSWARWLD